MDVRRLQTHHAVKAGVVNIGRHAETSTIGERGLPKDILRQSNEAALAHLSPCHLHFCQLQEEGQGSRGLQAPFPAYGFASLVSHTLMKT